MAPIDRLVERFAAPLEAAEADTDVIKTEFCDNTLPSLLLVTSLCGDFHAPNSAEWANILRAELLFSLPGKLEHVLSTLGSVKVEKRSCLANDLLDDLVLLKSGNTRPSLFGGLDSGLDCGTGLRDWTHRMLRSSNFEAAHATKLQ